MEGGSYLWQVSQMLSPRSLGVRHPNTFWDLVLSSTFPLHFSLTSLGSSFASEDSFLRSAHTLYGEPGHLD